MALVFDCVEKWVLLEPLRVIIEQKVRLIINIDLLVEEFELYNIVLHNLLHDFIAALSR